MVPENQEVTVCRIVCGTPFDEIGQGCRIGHCLLADVLVERHDTAVRNQPALIGGICHDRVLPASCTAGFHDNIYLVGMGRIQHLIEIGCCHTVVGLKVGTAHVNQDGYLVVSVSEQLRELLTRAAGYLGADIAEVGILICRGGRVPVSDACGGTLCSRIRIRICSRSCGRNRRGYRDAAAALGRGRRGSAHSQHVH